MLLWEYGAIFCCSISFVANIKTKGSIVPLPPPPPTPPPPPLPLSFFSFFHHCELPWGLFHEKHSSFHCMEGQFCKLSLTHENLRAVSYSSNSWNLLWGISCHRCMYSYSGINQHLISRSSQWLNIEIIRTKEMITQDNMCWLINIFSQLDP